MQPDETDAAYLWDMLEACREMSGFVEGVDHESFLHDRKLQLAAERCLEIIGEAAGRVSMKFQAEHPGIAWQKLRGMRNVLAHGYGLVDYAVVYETVTGDLPLLLKKLEILVD